MKKILAFLLVVVSTYYSKAQTNNPLDNSFGVNGRATGFITNGTWLNVRNLLVQPDGKIIQVSSTSNSGFIAVRYNANGSPDNSYGASSIAAAFSGQNSEAARGVLQSDGKLVVAGGLYTGGYSDVALARFNVDGTMDNSFGTGGKVVVLVTGNNDAAQALAIQPDGKIVVAGHSSGDCFTDCMGRQFCRPLVTLLRLHPNGSTDSSFGQNGRVVFGLGSFNSGIASSILIQPDGKIIALGQVQKYFCGPCSAGTTNAWGFSITRYLPDGSPDNGFGLNGQVMDTLELQNLSAALLQPDGRIVITASNFQGGFLTRRYNNDGSLDPAFTQSAITTGSINDMLLLPDGKLALGGSAYINNQRNFLIVQLKNNGAFDSSFNGTGRLYIRVGVPSDSDEGATGLALQGTQLLAGGHTQVYIGANSGYQHNQVVVRLGAAVGGPLPLTLLNLSAHRVEYEVDIKWQTQNEVNIKVFHIERSINGRTFDLIGFLTASGSLPGTNNYTFRDQHPSNGTNYYRLKMIDADGKFIYSKVVAVRMDSKGSLQIFPNPATNILFIQVRGVNEKATVQISDVSGRKLKEEKIILTGNTSFTVDVKDLPKGIYYLLLSTSSKIERVKFMKE